MVFVSRLFIRSILVLIVMGAFNTNAQVRYVAGINDNWKFNLGGLEYANNTDFDDAKWQTINLPHTWNSKDPFDDDETYVRGIGWYRKTFEIPESLEHKKIYLFFEGANQVTDVYVNGAFAGEHKGGYTAFSLDITALLKWGKPTNKNVIAVQVNNAHNNFIPPLSIGYALYGGIYRNVWVIATDDLHFKEINNSAGGVFINTTNVSAANATIKAGTTVLNESNRTRSFNFLNTVYDAAGKKLMSFSKEVSVDAGKEITFSVSAENMEKLHLWSPEDPYLYCIHSQLIEDNKIVDEVDNPLGFRWFHFTADSGFFLNGKKYLLHGVNRHQDMQDKGSALSSEDHDRDMYFIKNMGANFIRLAHYPQAPEVLQMADKLGLIIWEEIPVVDYMNIDPAFLANAKQMLLKMIHQQYNHPSIIMWGSMNEILLQSQYGVRIQKHIEDSLYVEGIRGYALQLDSMIRAEDPYRYTTMAMHGSGDYAKYKLDDIAQVKGYNIYNGWYSGKVEEFGKVLDKQHKAKPDFPIFVSEYGAEGEIHLNTEKPERMDYTGEYQRLYHESYLRQINQRPYLSGTAVWNEFDFSQPNIGGPAPHRNQKGLITWDRKPKDVYYLYKANWNPQPMIYIATRNWLIRAGETLAPSTIEVYTNLEEVSLYVNGILQGKQKPNDIKKCIWQVHLKDGENQITALGKQKGITFHDDVTVEYKSYSPNLTSTFPQQGIAINVGSNAQYTDPSGMVWIEDRPYTKGSFGFSGGNRQNFLRTKVIKNTKNTPLFYTYRDSINAYNFDVPDGKYMVTLSFAEPLLLNNADRIFDVAINNIIVLKSFDLTKEAGYAGAITKTFIADAQNTHGVQVKFATIKKGAILNGIKIQKL